MDDMQSQKIAFIVGAGASAEYRLPTGKELKKKINLLLDYRAVNGPWEYRGDHSIFGALQTHCKNENGDTRQLSKYTQAALKITVGLPLANSIDSFLYSHGDDAEIKLCGKLAIVKSILDAERQSSLWIDARKGDNSLDFIKLEETWLSKLFSLIFGSSSIKDIEKRFSEVSFIVFNYDRCVEHFLYHALISYFHITEIEASAIVNKANIFHPYGVVGKLPWQNGQQAIGYGAEVNHEILLSIAKEIKTFSEGTDPKSSRIDFIRGHILNDEKLVFLGYSYLPLNMELLNTKANNNVTRQKIFGTAKGISNSNVEVIEKHFRNSPKNNDREIYLNNTLTCAELFDEYARNILS